jgi:pepF/M3 family oligoendopeptidase
MQSAETKASHARQNWNLESVFPGGADSPQFAAFRKEIASDLRKAEEKLTRLPRKLDEGTVGPWTAFLLFMQDIMERIEHASGFTSCLIAQDVSDEKGMIYKEEVSSLYADWQKILTGIEEFAANVDDASWNRLIQSPQLIKTSFYWNEKRKLARLKMVPELEKLALDLAVNGYHAWSRLYTKMAGCMQVEFEHNGKIETVSMGQLANKTNSADRDVRRRAFEKMESTWESSASLAAMALNAQAGFRLSLYKRRGWDSALFEPVQMCRMKEETVGAMWDAVARGVRKMAAYVDAKKAYLGIDKFHWYDQAASIDAGHKAIPYDEACQFVIRHLSSFSDDIGRFARMAIDQGWVEAEDRPGKAAGAFCTGVDVIKQSRIFMTYSGNFDEVMTLAHELGHGYHSWVLRDHDYLARAYPINIGETASTFNELLVTDAALSAATDKNEKLALLDKKLQEGLIMFCNIRARFLFDSLFYEERKRGAVAKERLDEIMLEAQKTAFGDILANDGYHPLFWASKLHFFETGMPFYNFPYTFGYLFAGGVYDRAKKEGRAFAGKYKAMLADTGSMTTEEIALKHLGVDLSDSQFWNEAVARVLMDIEPFAELARQLHTAR